MNNTRNYDKDKIERTTTSVTKHKRTKHKLKSANKLFEQSKQTKKITTTKSKKKKKKKKQNNNEKQNNNNNKKHEKQTKTINT